MELTVETKNNGQVALSPVLLGSILQDVRQLSQHDLAVKLAFENPAIEIGREKPSAALMQCAAPLLCS